MSGNKSKIIAFNYFGGKFTFLDNLYDEFPNSFSNLIDVFGGSFVVSLNYKGKVIRTANEINSDITNFFKVLRDHEDELMHKLNLTPVSRTEYDNCWEKSEDNIEQARRFYVRVRQSFMGLGAQRRNKGWHMAKSKANVKGGESVSRWNNGLEKLYFVAEQIRKNFQITPYSYSECIDRLDCSTAFFYCDPPYPHEARTGNKDYKHEFSNQDHIDLSERLHNIEGKAMISSYNSVLYDELYHDWRKVEFPVKKNNIRSGEVQEVIWMNYPENKKDLFNQ